MQRQQGICLCTSCQDIKESVDILFMSRHQRVCSYIYKTVAAAGMFILLKRRPISSCTVCSCPTKTATTACHKYIHKAVIYNHCSFLDSVFYSVHSLSLSPQAWIATEVDDDLHNFSSGLWNGLSISLLIYRGSAHVQQKSSHQWFAYVKSCPVKSSRKSSYVLLMPRQQGVCSCLRV